MRNLKCQAVRSVSDLVIISLASVPISLALSPLPENGIFPRYYTKRTNCQLNPEKVFYANKIFPLLEVCLFKRLQWTLCFCPSESTIVLTLYAPSAKIMDARSFLVWWVILLAFIYDLCIFFLRYTTLVDVSGGRLL